jgi:hypothetical protein
VIFHNFFLFFSHLKHRQEQAMHKITMATRAVAPIITPTHSPIPNTLVDAAAGDILVAPISSTDAVVDDTVVDDAVVGDAAEDATEVAAPISVDAGAKTKYTEERVKTLKHAIISS